MNFFYRSYLRCFVKSAQASLDRSTCYKEIVPYANCLNEKANQLLLRASFNKTVDISKLQKDLFQTGKEYIKLFVKRFHQNSVVNNSNVPLVIKLSDPGAIII